MRVTVAVLSFIGLFWAAPALAETRVALVVGIAGYQHARELANPVADARAVGAALARRGFDLGPAGVLLNADKTGLERALRDFRARSQGAAIAVLYFAGHGIQIDGRNRLVPVDGKLDDLGDVELETVAVEAVLAQMRGTVNAVILDACRNNPFDERLARAAGGLGRSVATDRGMARIDAQGLSGGALLALAAAPGQLAKDGPTGGNSPYAAALVGLLDRPPTENPRLDLRKLFAAVRETVEEKTGGSQRPEAVDRLPSRDVYLIDAGLPALTATPIATTPGGRYALHIGNFMVAENAVALLRRLQDGGFQAYALKWTDSANKSWNTVRIGDYADFEAAKRVSAELNTKMGIRSAIVTTPR